MLLAIQMLFGVIQGDFGNVVAEFSGFVAGFAMSFLIGPGGWRKALAAGQVPLTPLQRVAELGDAEGTERLTRDRVDRHAADHEVQRGPDSGGPAGGGGGVAQKAGSTVSNR